MSLHRPCQLDAPVSGGRTGQQQRRISWRNWPRWNQGWPQWQGQKGENDDNSSRNRQYEFTDAIWRGRCLRRCAGWRVQDHKPDDYNGAEHPCGGDGVPTGNNLQNVGITVWWGNSLAANLTLTDVILGTDFVLSYMGGGTVPVYGSQLLIQAANTATTTVLRDWQLTTYAVLNAPEGAGRGRASQSAAERSAELFGFELRPRSVGLCVLGRGTCNSW